MTAEEHAREQLGHVQKLLRDLKAIEVEELEAKMKTDELAFDQRVVLDVHSTQLKPIENDNDPRAAFAPIRASWRSPVKLQEHVGPAPAQFLALFASWNTTIDVVSMLVHNDTDATLCFNLNTRDYERVEVIQRKWERTLATQAADTTDISAGKSDF